MEDNLFKTEIEAKNESDKINSKIPDKICPLINRICAGEGCMSWYKSRYYKRVDKQWKVIESECLSPMVTGVMEMNQ